MFIEIGIGVRRISYCVGKMTSILRSVFPVSTANHEVHDDYSVEYSFAMEYSGPSVSFEIPHVVPIDVDQIPTASVVSAASLISNLSLPVIQPIVKSNPLHKKSLKDSNLSTSLVSNTRPDDSDGPSLVESADGHGLPSAQVEVNSVESGLNDGDAADNQAADGLASSSSLGFSDSHDDSHELSGSSDIVESLQDSRNGDVCFGDDLDSPNSDSNEPHLSPPGHCSEIISCEEEGQIDEAPCQGNRTAVVTFREPESSEFYSEETVLEEPEIFSERQASKVYVKKRLCYRCHKGNRFTEKEVCIVCGAKYCSNCVLRAMGSMPEGRKCITCIGFRIDESKRDSLGNCSRMLKHLLTPWEVKRIMSCEMSCKANRLSPSLVFVNGRPLSEEELILLQSCPNPPTKLKPGKYWYDKVSGYWGKEGQKPCQIISPKLHVGDAIMGNASKGNTNVWINNREITKSELLLFRLARIQCEGSPHFWLDAEGSYQEEGQKNVMGNLWDKTGIKLLCTVLSLPMPPVSEHPRGEEVDNASDKFVSNCNEPDSPIKLLLIGYDQSGTSTLFKQAKSIYNVPFSQDERQTIKLMIQNNLYRYLGILLEVREKFEAERAAEIQKARSDQASTSAAASYRTEEKNIYSINPKLRAFSNWLLQVMMSGNLDSVFPAANREYAPLVEELWKDRALQATYRRRNELHMLPSIANYFLDRAVDISRIDYEPSDVDILNAEGISPSNGLACMEFSFPKSTQDSFLESTDQDEPLRRYQLIRVHTSSLGENCKWLEMFENVDLVIYCVSLIDYDQFLVDNHGNCSNKMLASKKLFESIITHPTFSDKNFLLMLNKFDLLEKKIEQIPLNQCDWFHDFNPVIGYHHNNNNNTNASLSQRAFHYIAVKFKRVYNSLTGRKLYVSPVTGLEPKSIDEALRYGREILKCSEDKPTSNVNEWSTESIDASSTS